jgi:hypothetical protein
MLPAVAATAIITFLLATHNGLTGVEGAVARQEAPIRVLLVEPFTDTVCFAMETALSGTILTKEGMVC